MLFPTQGDVELFEKLITIVKSADDQNKKIKQMTDNVDKFANIVVKLLEKIV